MLANFAAREDEEWISKQFLRAELAGLQTELKADVASLRVELHTEIGGLRSELHTEIGGLRSEVHAGTQRLIMWMVGTNITLFALLFALLRLTT
ncbi:MAG: hypothetical protein ACR2JF_11715 [Iamia sp.]